MQIHRLLTAATLSFFTITAYAADPVAWDMGPIDASGIASQSLIAHQNPYVNAFSSAGDGSQKYQRGVSVSIPFSVLDDSLSIFTGDNLGIIGEDNTDEFFGITDTVNGDNSGGQVTASWAFDVSGALDLAVAVDIGAMGDFETSDTFVWTYSLDGGPAQPLFSTLVDEAASQQYTLQGGNSIMLDDPLTLDGVLLGNTLQTFNRAISGSGTVLTIFLEASTDGGSEALAFQKLVVLENYEVAEPELTLIHEVQGDGDSSPLAGSDVIVEGIVTGDFQSNGTADDGDLEGFFLQEEDSDADDNAATSEGIFIFDRFTDVDVSKGDLVRVTGTVSEFNGLTEITAASIEVVATGLNLPLATLVQLPFGSHEEPEAMEGMFLRFDQNLVISEYFNFDRFGEIVLAQPLPGEERPWTPTAIEEPGSQAFSDRLNANLLSRLTLDDGATSSNPAVLRHPNGEQFTLLNRFRGGDLVTGATGVLDYRFGLYRLQPTAAATYTPVNIRPDLPPAVPGTLRVVSFNVLNYFDTIDQGPDVCGPQASLDCRGADTEEEFQRQQIKIVKALAALDADIVGLIEIENNATAVSVLASAVNGYLGEEVYSPVLTGSIGTDAIKVGFLYKQSSVSPVGDYAVLDSTVDARFIDTRNRPVLAQTFSEASEGAVFTVAINHFKSKGSACDDLGDPDAGDGQGNCNLTRAQAAEALADWLASDPTGSGDPDMLILGDLNAYDHEDPITVLTENGYTDLQAYFGGEFVYGYVFDGQFGYLDYALANETMLAQTSGAASWHINADEPDILDYDMSFKPPEQEALFEENVFRSSDHDPVLVGINLDTPNAPPVCTQAYASEMLLWPPNGKYREISVLGITDPENDALSVTITGVFQDEPLISEGDDTAVDAFVEGDVTFVRAERSDAEGADGRVYHIAFMAEDEAGMCTGVISPAVPKNQGVNGSPVDGGALYDSLGEY